MNKKGVFILTLLMILLFTISSFADSIDSASNYFAFKENVNITDDVLGDVYSAGRDVKVKNSVDGDIIVAGETINIKSKEIQGNVRCAAQTLNIDSKKIKNITCVGQNVDIGKNTTAKAIYVAGQNINFKGSCKGFYATGQTIIINGKIDGNFKVNCDELIIADKGEITGDIEVYSPKEPIVNSNVSMNDIKYIKTKPSNDENKLKTFAGFETIISIIAAILLGIIIYSIFKKFFINNDGLFLKEPLIIVLGGIVSFILVPIISLLLFITVIGLPLGILSLIMYFVVVYLSPVIIGIILGRIILKNKNPYIQLVIGILVIKLLSLLPMIGNFIWVVSAMIVQGIIIYNFSKSIKYKEYRI
ncbi:hypothetical protein [Terrisporobacter sp.]